MAIIDRYPNNNYYLILWTESENGVWNADHILARYTPFRNVSDTREIN